MQEQEPDPFAAICLLAALADGRQSDVERAALARTSVLTSAGDGPPALTLGAAAAMLGTADERRRAYEMAVSIVYADGNANPAEAAFLDRLREALGSTDEGLGAVQREVEALTTVSLAGSMPDNSHGPPPSDGQRPSQAGIPAVSHDAALDELIKKQALLCGALELLPQNLASLAIIPLQVRLVYRIGLDFGQTLEAPQIRDLFGAMGIGAAAQVLDGMSRRILGGLGRGVFGRVLGGVVGGTAGFAAGAGMSFVITYAIGHAAKQYYAQGRELSREDLLALFQRFKGEGEMVLPRVQEEIHGLSQRVDLTRVLGAIRGSPTPAG
jgi:uncharacterized protein (DUF697 family)